MLVVFWQCRSFVGASSEFFFLFSFFVGLAFLLLSVCCLLEAAELRRSFVRAFFVVCCFLFAVVFCFVVGLAFFNCLFVVLLAASELRRSFVGGLFCC